MDDCTDILTPGDDRAKISNLQNPYSNIIYLNGSKNPFDRQFELALKNGYKGSSSSSSSNNTANSFRPSSPLNTPLIPLDSALNTAAVFPDPSPAITTAQITNLILETEIIKETEQLNNNAVVTEPAGTLSAVDPTTTLVNTNINSNGVDAVTTITEQTVNIDQVKIATAQLPTPAPAKTTIENSIKPDIQLKNETQLNKTHDGNNNNVVVNQNNNKIKQRSNVVSVICPPVPQFRDAECSRSAPIILESANSKQNDQVSSLVVNKILAKADKQPDITPGNLLSQQNLVESTTVTATTGSIITNTILTQVPGSILNEASIPLLPVQISTTKTTTTSTNKELCSLTNSISEPTTAINYNYHPLATTTSFQTNETTCSTTLKKILPKEQPIVRSILNNHHNSHLDNKAQRAISSLPPPRRKEKTLDELMSKIRATEAALPPKAKPGRKSKQAAEEDQQEKKRLSLERNRAAAMRCRLKKKKEIDELKQRVETYEQQNQHLKKIIDELYNEVASLKNELMLHKDCH